MLVDRLAQLFPEHFAGSRGAAWALEYREALAGCMGERLDRAYRATMADWRLTNRPPAPSHFRAAYDATFAPGDIERRYGHGTNPFQAADDLRQRRDEMIDAWKRRHDKIVSEAVARGWDTDLEHHLRKMAHTAAQIEAAGSGTPEDDAAHRYGQDRWVTLEDLERCKDQARSRNAWAARGGRARATESAVQRYSGSGGTEGTPEGVSASTGSTGA